MSFQEDGASVVIWSWNCMEEGHINNAVHVLIENASIMKYLSW